MPGARALFRHEYPITPGILGALGDAQPDVVVVSGWSTFASQAALAWCRLRRIPYVLLVESHDAGPKAGWRRVVKTTAVPPILRSAASVLVVGSLARESVLALGADPARVRVFSNTIDVEAWVARVDQLAARRSELRAAFGLGDEVVVAQRREARAGEGAGRVAEGDHGGGRPARWSSALGPSARTSSPWRGDAIFTGELPWDRVTEAYAAADIFALCLRTSRGAWS